MLLFIDVFAHLIRRTNIPYCILLQPTGPLSCWFCLWRSNQLGFWRILQHTSFYHPRSEWSSNSILKRFGMGECRCKLGNYAL